MKHIFIWWVLFFATVSIQAQTVTIVDQQTQKPIEGVVLYSESPQASEVTNVNGQADILVFKNSEVILIQTLGYKAKGMTYKEIEKANYIIELEETSLNLEQIVISGTRWKQTNKNVPAKISTVTPKEVRLLNPQTAADLLAVSGKVFVQKSQQGGGSPMIRGFATNRLVYAVDGVRMNTAIFRSGNVQNVINIDPFATEHTEVLFGPGSVIYGSDAIGGVMSFQTLTPQMSLTKKPLITGKAVTRYSSANQEKTAHFDVNVGWKKWAFVTSFSSWNFDHLRQGSNGPDDYIKGVYAQRQDSVDVVITQDDPLLQIPSAYSQINLMQKVRFKPNKKWDFQYGFHYSETSPYGRYDRHNRYKNGNLRYAEWNYGPQSWMMNNVNITHAGQHTIYDQFSLRLAQQSFGESRIVRALNANERTTNNESVQAYSVNVDFVKSIKAKHTYYTRHKLFYGAEYVFNDVNSQGVVTDVLTGLKQAGPSRYPQATWTSMAVYVNDEMRITEKLALQGGLRYNQFIIKTDFRANASFYPFPFTTSEVNNGALTGSIGGVYRPKSSWVVKANFGTAFRAPNVDDMGKIFDSEPGAVTIPNPELEAEYAYNVDVGVAKVFGKFLKVDLTAYYTILQNAMVRRNYQLNGVDSILYAGEMSQVQAIQNAAVANVYGIQAGIELKLPAGFTLLSDFNYQKGQEELDNGTISSSRHAAPMFGVTRLRYKHKELSLEFNTQYQGEQSFANLAQDERTKDEIYAKDASGNNYAPAWYTLNIKALYNVTPTFSVSGGLENLTDQRYRPYSSGLSGAGRNFIISVRAHF